MNDIYDVAKWFLAKKSMTPKKLQKLCYYYVAWGYALLDREVIENSHFEAWVHGPVSPALYQKYKDYGWNEIEKEEDIPIFENAKERELFESVYLTYGDLSANELEALSHSEMPWRKARGNCGKYDACNKAIDLVDMKNFYSSIYQEDQGE